MCAPLRVSSISWVSSRVCSTAFSCHGSATKVLKVLTYIDVSASAAGISPEFSFYLVSIANAGSGLGRILSGMLADKFGPLTVTAPLNLLCAIMTYIWPHATTKGPLIVIGIIYGFCSGAYVSLVPAPFIMMGDTHDAGRRTGTAFSVIAFGALAGPPVSGAIYQATGGFNDVGYYAGNVLDHTLRLVGFTKMPSLKDRASLQVSRSYTSRNTWRSAAYGEIFNVRVEAITDTLRALGLGRIGRFSSGRYRSDNSLPYINRRSPPNKPYH